MTGSTTSSTSAAITFPPLTIEPPRPKPSRRGPRSPGLPAWHSRQRAQPAARASDRPQSYKLTMPLARNDHYPSGAVVPSLARAFVAFQRRYFSAAIEAIEPVWDQRDRLVGSL